MELSRRRFLGYAGGGVAAAGIVGCSSDDVLSTPESDAPTSPAAEIIPFRTERQAGITAAATSAGIVAGLDVRVGSRRELVELFETVSGTIETLMSAEPFPTRDGGFPPLDTGILGPDPEPTSTAVVVGVGDSLFDDRFGLGDRKPLELQRMFKFANDYLVREERSHGDMSLVISAVTHEAAMHALRQILRVTRGQLIPKWIREGFNDLIPGAGPGEAPVRNLMGFKDGTSNPDPVLDAELMEEVVWVQDGEGQPDWAIGGTYQVIRVIRMQVEFWDRTRLNEQEAIFHRDRATGAPLIGGNRESDAPEFDGDFTSHIARANPRTPGSEANRIFRKGFNYVDGIDVNEQLDQGLLFTCYQRSLENGFIAVQRRLDGEALEEYIRPLGGGFFFALPGPANEEYLGQNLLS